MAGCFLPCCPPGAGGIREGTQTSLDHTKRGVSALLTPRIVVGPCQRLLGYQRAPARKATGENALAPGEIWGWPYIGKPKSVGKAWGQSWLPAWKELGCLAVLWLQQHRYRHGCVSLGSHVGCSWGTAALGVPGGTASPWHGILSDCRKQSWKQNLILYGLRSQAQRGTGSQQLWHSHPCRAPAFLELPTPCGRAAPAPTEWLSLLRCIVLLCCRELEKPTQLKQCVSSHVPSLLLAQPTCPGQPRPTS